MLKDLEFDKACQKYLVRKIINTCTDSHIMYSLNETKSGIRISLKINKSFHYYHYYHC